MPCNLGLGGFTVLFALNENSHHGVHSTKGTLENTSPASYTFRDERAGIRRNFGRHPALVLSTLPAGENLAHIQDRLSYLSGVR